MDFDKIKTKLFGNMQMGKFDATNNKVNLLENHALQHLFDRIMKEGKPARRMATPKTLIIS